MGRHCLEYNKTPHKASSSAVVQSRNKQTVKSRRVILLDTALELQLKPSSPYETPKIYCSKVSARQSNHTVFESSDRISLVKSNHKKPKVNFVNFIDYSKDQTEKNNKVVINHVKQAFVQFKAKQQYSTKPPSESNKNNSLVSEQGENANDNEKLKNNNTDAVNHVKKVVVQFKANQQCWTKSPSEINENNSLVSEQGKNASDNKKLKASELFLNLVPVNKRILEQIILKKEQQKHKNQLETQKKQAIEEEAQLLKSTKSTPMHLMSSIDCGKISKVLNEQQLLSRKISLQRVIKLRPLNLNTFKSSKKNKKYPLSTIVKTVIKNNLSNDLQKNSSKEAFPVALKSINNDDIELLNIIPTNQSSEQILGM